MIASKRCGGRAVETSWNRILGNTVALAFVAVAAALSAGCDGQGSYCMGSPDAAQMSAGYVGTPSIRHSRPA